MVLPESHKEIDVSVYSFNKLMSEARKLAADYRHMTGNTLPISGEIARHDAATLLGMTLVEAGGGYDALDHAGNRVQIKGRVQFDGQKSKPRVGQLRIGQNWDVAVLVLMDENYEPVEIFQMTHEKIKALMEDGVGKRRIGRGAMSVARFRAAGECVWSREVAEQEAQNIRLVISN